MKKIVKIIIFVFLFVIAMDVKADDSLWNKSYEHNGFKYNIESFTLEIYKKAGVLSPEELGDLVETVNLSPNEYTIDPKYTDTDIYDTNTILKGTFIDLNLNLTDEKIKNYLYNKYGDPVETTYTFFIKVNYNVTQIPSAYTYVYYVNLRDYLMNLENSYIFPKFELNKTKTQIIGSGYYYQSFYPAEGVEVSGDTEMYSFDYWESISMDMYAYNYLLLKNNELVESSSNEKITSNDYIFMFHNKNNIDNAIKHFNAFTNMDDYEETSKSTPSGNSTNENNQVVTVDDTALNVPIIITIVGCLILIMGISTIMYTMFRKDNSFQE